MYQGIDDRDYIILINMNTVLVSHGKNVLTSEKLRMWFRPQLPYLIAFLQELTPEGHLKCKFPLFRARAKNADYRFAYAIQLAKSIVRNIGRCNHGGIDIDPIVGILWPVSVIKTKDIFMKFLA